MDTSTTFLVIFGVIMLFCCLGPMLFMRKGHGNSGAAHTSDAHSKPEPKTKV